MSYEMIRSSTHGNRNHTSTGNDLSKSSNSHNRNYCSHWHFSGNKTRSIGGFIALFLVVVGAVIGIYFAVRPKADDEKGPLPGGGASTNGTLKENQGNCNGCASCSTSEAFVKDCHGAVGMFRDGVNYSTNQRFTVGACYADWWCGGAYPQKDGKDIKNVFNYGIYQKAGCKACGEWWLSDGSTCHGTVQAHGC